MTPTEQTIINALRNGTADKITIRIAADMLEAHIAKSERTNRLAETLKRGTDEIAARLAQHK